MEKIKASVVALNYEGNNYRYTAQVIRTLTKENISNHVEEINISLPTSSSNITSMKASFVASKDVVVNGDFLTVQVLDEIGNIIYFLNGEAKVLSKAVNNIGNIEISIDVVDELDKLFEKVVNKDVFFFDQWLCNNDQKENSILFQVAKELGFDETKVKFEDIRDTNSQLIKIPFMAIRTGNKWIDELHTIVDCTKGLLYIENEKLIFKNNIFKYTGGEIEEFNSTNILKNIVEETEFKTNNGVKLLYSTFKYQDNQTVFDLSEKVVVKPSTTPENQKLEFNIKYITDVVIHHNLTSAQGYYYPSSDSEELVRIDLIEGTHYEFIEFRESNAVVKFYNPLTFDLYIDKFEIKGIPIVKYEDNQAVAKDSDVILENQENFKDVDKNKYIQTEELATNLVKLAYKNILTKKKFNFTTNFHPGYELGKIYGLVLNDIFSKITLDEIKINLSRTKGFTINISATEYIEDEISNNISITENKIFKDKYLEDLKNKVDDLIDEQTQIVKSIGTKGFISETDPKLDGKDVKEPDVWFNPKTKLFKVWRNGEWHRAREEDIPPALMTALKAQGGYFTIGGNDVMAGIFFSYDNDPNNPLFGASDTEHLAQVSIDKKANVLIKNANNKLAFNMRNPENPSEIISQLLMGVYNSDDAIHKDTLVQFGDESTGTYIQFLRGNTNKIVANGNDVGESIDNVEKGKLLINANTVFDGTGTFVSSGSNESTIIKNGSIEFLRNGVPVTVIRNVRAGSVATNGNGIGYVDFYDMKSNLIILPSIKAFNVSANVRTLNCRAEKDPNFIAQNRWRFYVYGTEEVVENTTIVESPYTSYTVNAYHAGAVSAFLNTSQVGGYGYNTGYLGETSDGISNVNLTWESQMVLAVKTYIDNAYYGEVTYNVPSSALSSYYTENGHYQILHAKVTIPTVEITVNGVTKTTIDKTDKNIRYEYYIKNYGVVRSSFSTNSGLETHTAQVLTGTIQVNFVKGKYQYSPTLIQNIVGGGEVQYLAMEQ